MYIYIYIRAFCNSRRKYFFRFFLLPGNFPISIVYINIVLNFFKPELTFKVATVR